MSKLNCADAVTVEINTTINAAATNNTLAGFLNLTLLPLALPLTANNSKHRSI